MEAERKYVLLTLLFLSLGILTMLRSWQDEDHAVSILGVCSLLIGMYYGITVCRKKGD